MNVFELSGFPRRETVASNVLAYFFDPDERHRLGTRAVDSLLGLLDGAPLVGAQGRDDLTAFVAGPHLASTGWAVETEAPTPDRKRIDIYLTNREFGVAIIVENKLDAAVYNPFESYAAHALRDHATVLAVVMSPTRRAAEALGSGAGRWVSAAITYDDLFDRLAPAVATAGLAADQRSVDLLHQLIENTSEREVSVDRSADAAVVEQFWDALRGHEDSYREFFAALGRVNDILKRRSRQLHSVILERLELRGIVTSSFVSAGYDAKWGIRDGRVAEVYIGVGLVPDLTAELIVGFVPSKNLYGLSVKGYGNGHSSNHPFPEYDHRPLGVGLDASDAEIADHFADVVERLLLDHARS